MAETKTATTATKKTTESTAPEKETKVYSAAEVDALLQSAVANALKNYAPQQNIMKVVPEEYVTVLYLGKKARGTKVVMPSWGTITIEGGLLDIPKKDFIAGLGSSTNEALLRKKKVIVVAGLTDEERRRYNCFYDEKQLLSQDAFFKLLDFHEKELSTVCEGLCVEHFNLVIQVFKDAYFEKHDPRVTIPKVKALNKVGAKRFGKEVHNLQDVLNDLADEMKN